MTDNFFFISAKLFWALASPDSLILLLALLGWGFLALGRNRIARRLLSLCTLLLLCIAFLPLGQWLLAPLEARFPANIALPAEADGIIVLGGAIDPQLSAAWQQTQLNDAAERLTAFVYLAKLYPGAQLVYSGGSGSLTGQQFREADHAPFILAQLGLEERAIIYESESRNTHENAANSRVLVNPGAGQDWVLVTSAYHMPRAVGVFCAQDWPVTAYPVDHRALPGQSWRVEFSLLDNLAQLRTAMREWLALAAYRLTGRSGQLLPGLENYCAAAGNKAEDPLTTP